MDEYKYPSAFIHSLKKSKYSKLLMLFVGFVFIMIRTNEKYSIQFDYLEILMQVIFVCVMLFLANFLLSRDIKQKGGFKLVFDGATLYQYQFAQLVDKVEVQNIREITKSDRGTQVFKNYTDKNDFIEIDKEIENYSQLIEQLAIKR
jgi:hypothetical protein